MIIEVPQEEKQALINEMIDFYDRALEYMKQRNLSLPEWARAQRSHSLNHLWLYENTNSPLPGKQTENTLEEFMHTYDNLNYLTATIEDPKKNNASMDTVTELKGRLDDHEKKIKASFDNRKKTSDYYMSNVFILSNPDQLKAFHKINELSKKDMSKAISKISEEIQKSYTTHNYNNYNKLIVNAFKNNSAMDKERSSNIEMLSHMSKEFKEYETMLDNVQKIRQTVDKAAEKCQKQAPKNTPKIGDIFRANNPALNNNSDYANLSKKTEHTIMREHQPNHAFDPYIPCYNKCFEMINSKVIELSGGEISLNAKSPKAQVIAAPMKEAISVKQINPVDVHTPEGSDKVEESDIVEEQNRNNQPKSKKAGKDKISSSELNNELKSNKNQDKKEKGKGDKHLPAKAKAKAPASKKPDPNKSQKPHVK